jgi:type I restriction enzyme S subunit
MNKIDKIKTGYKETKIGLIPEDWNCYQLKHNVRIAEGQVSPIDEKYGDYYHIGPENIKSDSGQLNGLVKIKDADLISGKYYFDEDSIVYSKIRPNLNKVCLPRFKGLCSADAYPLWAINNNHTEYLFYFIQSQMFVKQAVMCSMRTGLPKINRIELNSFWIAIPPLPEQKKIADILSTWDRAIEKTEKLVDAKIKLKKGLMQNLLTGRKRFQEFIKSDKVVHTRYGNIPAEWSYIHIKEIAREVSEKNKNGKQLTVLSCTKYNGLMDSLKYFKRQVFSDDTSTYKIVKREQFAYATNHIEEGSIGYQYVCDEALISPMYTVFETNNKVNDDFLYKLLKTELYRHIFEVNTSASVDRRGSLRWDEFSLIKIPLPLLDEQKYIASVLSTIDKEISVLNKKLEAISQQKKGLMQKLLTGQVRVKV